VYFRTDARRISFSAKDGTLLDGAIVVAADKQCHVDLHPTNENPPDTAATSTDTRLVVLCNPNAAFYEGHHYWVEFYTRLGALRELLDAKLPARSTGSVVFFRSRLRRCCLELSRIRREPGHTIALSMPLRLTTSKCSQTSSWCRALQFPL